MFFFLDFTDGDNIKQDNFSDKVKIICQPEPLEEKLTIDDAPLRIHNTRLYKSNIVKTVTSENGMIIRNFSKPTTKFRRL